MGRKKSTAVAVIPDREPWDKQPGEGAKAYAAFAHYRDSDPGTRSLTNTARHLSETLPERVGKPESIRTQLSGWSVKWHWVERVEAFTIAEDRRRRLERQALQREMEERHLDGGNQLLFAALARARGMAAGDGRAAVTRLDPGSIDSWGELSAVIERAVRIQRLTVGLPTDLTKNLDSFGYAEVLAIVSDIVDFALEDLGGELHERFLQRVRDRLNQPRRG